MCLLFAQFPYASLHITLRLPQFFSPHFSVHISESCLCTRLVFTYIVALFQCFRMVPVSCSSGGGGGGGGGGEQKHAPKNCTPLEEIRLKHP